MQLQLYLIFSIYLQLLLSIYFVHPELATLVFLAPGQFMQILLEIITSKTDETSSFVFFNISSFVSKENVLFYISTVICLFRLHGFINAMYI